MFGHAAVVTEMNPGKGALFGIRPRYSAQTHATLPRDSTRCTGLPKGTWRTPRCSSSRGTTDAWVNHELP